MSEGWENGPKGFGLPIIKHPECPIHPDDINHTFTDEQYGHQLEAYLKNLEKE